MAELADDLRPDRIFPSWMSSSGRRVLRAVGQIVEAGQGAGRYSELLAINLLEQLLLRPHGGD